MTDTQDKKKRSTLTLNRSVATTTVDKPSNVQQNMTNNKLNNVTVEVRKNKFARPDDEQKKNLDKMLSEGHLSEDELKARLRAVVKNNASSTEKIAHTPSYSSMKKDINQTISDEDNVNNELESQDSDVIQEKEELDINALENIPELKQVDELNTKEKQPGFDDSTISNKPKTEIAANFNDTEEESDFVKSKNAKSPKNTIVKKLEQKFAPKIHEVEEEYTGGRRIGTPKKSKKQKIREKIKFDKLVREVFVPENITVSELANRMSERSVDVIKELMKLGIMANAAQKIDQDTAEIIVTSLGHIFRPVSENDIEQHVADIIDSEDTLYPRPPVVTVMGHVDHGKTSLLDALRSTDVALGESGGITQHIGAYQVELPNKQKITFLDTPGHEAFTAMRSRGAKATDIVILVVAADDGIMTQTIEAINHAKAANVPIIVAINKMDKVGADASRVKNELLSHEIVSEEFGGDVMMIEVSAKEKTNLDKLEEAVLLQAEILELKANPNREAYGVVIESKVEKGIGPVISLLVQKGTLKAGDIVVAGHVYGKIRAIKDSHNRNLKEALPSTPVEVIGINDTATAGDIFSVVATEKQARDICEYRLNKIKDMRTNIQRVSSLEEFIDKSATADLKYLPLIIKADVNGSAEAIIASLNKIPSNEIKVQILHSGVGGINESDITLGVASRAVVFGFNVRANNAAKELASKEKIEIRYYSIIYDLINDVKALVSGMMAPTLREEYLGQAEIRNVFNITKVGKVAGCYVTQGMIKRGAGVRLIREGVVIHTGKLKTLKRFKDEVKEVKDNFECGMAFENYDDIREKDVIEAFEIISEARGL